MMVCCPRELVGLLWKCCVFMPRNWIGTVILTDRRRPPITELDLELLSMCLWYDLGNNPCSTFWINVFTIISPNPVLLGFRLWDPFMTLNVSKCHPSWTGLRTCQRETHHLGSEILLNFWKYRVHKAWILHFLILHIDTHSCPWE